jgi:hypothetical protein
MKIKLDRIQKWKTTVMHLPISLTLTHQTLTLCQIKIVPLSLLFTSNLSRAKPTTLSSSHAWSSRTLASLMEELSNLCLTKCNLTSKYKPQTNAIKCSLACLAMVNKKYWTKFSLLSKHNLRAITNRWWAPSHPPVTATTRCTCSSYSRLNNSMVNSRWPWLMERQWPTYRINRITVIPN